MVIFSIIMVVLLVIDALLYGYVVDKTGPKHNFIPFSGFYEFYKYLRREK